MGFAFGRLSHSGRDGNSGVKGNGVGFHFLDFFLGIHDGGKEGGFSLGEASSMSCCTATGGGLEGSGRTGAGPTLCVGAAVAVGAAVFAAALAAPTAVASDAVEIYLM